MIDPEILERLNWSKELIDQFEAISAHMPTFDDALFSQPLFQTETVASQFLSAPAEKTSGSEIIFGVK